MDVGSCQLAHKLRQLLEKSGLVDLPACIQQQSRSCRLVVRVVHLSRDECTALSGPLSSIRHHPHSVGSVLGELRKLLAAGERLDKFDFLLRVVRIRVFGEKVLPSCHAGCRTEESLPSPQ